MAETEAGSDRRSRDAPPAETLAKDPRFSVEFMDRAEPPSVDFYRYATGRWRADNPIPADKATWGAFDELLQQNFRAVREILEAAASDTPPAGPGRQVGDFYVAALDTARRNAVGLGPIRADLARVEAVSSTAELFRELAALHREGFEGLFDSAVAPDLRRSDRYAFYLGQGGLSLPDRDYYLDTKFEEIRTAYRAHLIRSFRALGDDTTRASAHADTVLEIETEFAKSSRTRTELRDAEKNYHRVEVDALATAHPATPWGAYLADREVGVTPYVIVEQPEFLVALDRMLKERATGDWTTYLRWHVLRNAAPYLDEATEADSFDFFHRTLLGQPNPEPAWRRAAIAVDAQLGEALGELYVARHFTKEARARMQEMVDDLRAVFRDRLAALAWMSEATRQRALEKFARFEAKIGHPDKFRDYSSIRVVRDDFFGDLRRARAFEVHRRVVRVGGPVDRTEWGMTPPTVNAYFSPVKNEIVFPAGILQPPFFDVTMDDAVNYGGIGAVIGHEITHGYDDQGRKYDADGNLADWWTEVDRREFERRAHQVVEEYGRYEPLPGLHVNGELTLGENLADLGGVSIAFEALQRRLAREPERRRTIDGLTPEQRFFLSWAQVWRDNTREPEIRRRVVIDPHAPGRFRAVGAPGNMDAFYEAFRIPSGSPMWRPTEARVTVW